MNDLILNDIVTTLTNEGYAVLTKTEPNLMSWNNLPAVLVVPDTRNIIMWHAFGDKSQTHRYEAIYISNNQLNTLPTDESFNFKQFCITTFMNVISISNFPTSKDAGVWQCRVNDQVDYKRHVLPDGYNYSGVNIEVWQIL